MGDCSGRLARSAERSRRCRQLGVPKLAAGSSRRAVPAAAWQRPWCRHQDQLANLGSSPWLSSWQLDDDLHLLQNCRSPRRLLHLEVRGLTTLHAHAHLKTAHADAGPHRCRRCSWLLSCLALVLWLLLGSVEMELSLPAKYSSKVAWEGRSSRPPPMPSKDKQRTSKSGTTSSERYNKYTYLAPLHFKAVFSGPLQQSSNPYA
mmetsp:Transcript_31661/g.73942  ORF Transcript_31661/g.73942 Transcript_31661/m.73942 type:complete len:204 (+) Transcript_31661:773-1384(+)